MEFIKVKIDKLKYAKYNPRKKLTPEDIEYKKIKNSIQEFGYVDPVIINSDYTIIGGHQRVSVLKDLGFEEIEVIRIDIDKTKEKALNIALNKITGEWDYGLLQDLLIDLDTLNYNLDFTGFDIDEIDEILNPLEPEKDYDVVEVTAPALPNEPKAKLGEIYQLGRHRLMCGDSTKEEDVEKLMNHNIADVLFTDPPYNVNISNSQGMTIINDNLEDNEFRSFLNKAFKCASESLKEGGAFYIWHADNETINFRQTCEENGLSIRQCLIWVKNGFNFGRQDYKWKHEPCLYGWKEGACHYFIEEYNHPTVIEDVLDLDKMKKDELRHVLEEFLAENIPTTIIHENKPLINDLHPTMKPIKMCADLIRNSSRRKEIILDLFGGSGSTLIACEQIDRTCYMMEYDPAYVDVIIKRWEDFTGEKATRLN